MSDQSPGASLTSLTQARFARAAADAVAYARAIDLDLDGLLGAKMAFTALADEAIELPLPGAGNTAARFAAVAAVATVDVTLGRLFEAHADALAILAELAGRDPQKAAGERWGVWAAEGPLATVSARAGAGEYQLLGAKPWCSGATLCTHALVTAGGQEDRRLYRVSLEADSVKARTGTWRGLGMTGSSTETVDFSGASASPVGACGSYLTRPGFWNGAVGVAAAWWGAAAGVAKPLYSAAESKPLQPHALAHLGAIETCLASSAALLRESAARIDAGVDVGQGGALAVRAAVEGAATEVIDRVGRALGPTPLCQDRIHARRVADLTVYLRQSHAESDLETLARMINGAPTLAGSFPDDA